MEHLQLRQKETQNLSEQHLFSNTAPGFEPSKTTSDYLPASTTFAYLRHSILLFQKISSKTQFSAKLPMTKLSTAVTAATGFRKESFSLLNVLAFTLTYSRDETTRPQNLYTRVNHTQHDYQNPEPKR